jgi:hypothetical protein
LTFAGPLLDPASIAEGRAFIAMQQSMGLRKVAHDGGFQQRMGTVFLSLQN